MALLGSRPYFMRAVNEWILDQGLTPYLLVDANWPGAEVPLAYIEDGRIVLNINPSAVRDLLLANEEVSFSARFSGQTHWIRAPIGAVLGIYARENGEGLFFDADEYSPEPEPTLASVPNAADSSDAPASTAGSKPRPTLRVVK